MVTPTIRAADIRPVVNESAIRLTVGDKRFTLKDVEEVFDLRVQLEAMAERKPKSRTVPAWVSICAPVPVHVALA